MYVFENKASTFNDDELSLIDGEIKPKTPKKWHFQCPMCSPIKQIKPTLLYMQPIFMLNYSSFY